MYGNSFNFEKKGLFDGAIAESGSSLCNWAFSKESSIENMKRLAMDLNCNRSSSKDIMDCLREKSPTDILNSDYTNPKVNHEKNLYF